MPNAYLRPKYLRNELAELNAKRLMTIVGEILYEESSIRRIES
jgi:hypothetical protein